jgi:hypothetical protein
VFIVAAYGCNMVYFRTSGCVQYVTTGDINGGDINWNLTYKLGLFFLCRMLNIVALKLTNWTDINTDALHELNICKDLNGVQ